MEPETDVHLPDSAGSPASEAPTRAELESLRAELRANNEAHNNVSAEILSQLRKMDDRIESRLSESRTVIAPQPVPPPQTAEPESEPVPVEPRMAFRDPYGR